MSTLEIREKLHQYVDNSEDDIINAVFAFFKSYSSSSKISKSELVEYNAEIETAMKEIDKGNFYTENEVEAILKKRYEKTNLV